MTNLPTLRTFVHRLLHFSLYVALLVLLLPAHLHAQNIQYNNNAVDLGMRSSLKVHPTTRGMELQIPLGHYRGRNGFDIPVTISYSSKLWTIEFQGFNTGAPPPHQPPPFTIVTADYARRSVRGWTTTVDMPHLDFTPGNRIYDMNGAPNISGNCTNGCYVIDRMMVWMPDGSGHELRASDQPRQTTQAAPDDLYSVDGSRMRYQKSTSTLFLPDGSRYLTAQSKYVDRNGNTITASNGFRDTLDRQINSPFPWSHGSGPLSPTDQAYSLPGVGGTPLNYTFKWRNLGDVLTTPQTLRYTGNSGCPPGMGGSYSPNLFSSDFGTSTCIGNSGVLFNPVVLWQIVLPNGQNYTFSYDIYGAIEKVVLPTGGYEKFEQGSIPPISSSLNFKWVYSQANRGVLRHKISPSGQGNDEIEWVYTGSQNSATVTAPDGTRTERYVWSEGTSGWTYANDSSRAGRTYDERVFSASGQMIRRKLTSWVMTPSNASGSFPGALAANRNARVAREIEFFLDTSSGPALAKSTTFGYDLTYQYNVGVDQTSVNEFAFVEVDLNTAQTIAIGSMSSIPNGTLLRTTETDYLTADVNYRSRNILGLPSSKRVKNGAGTVVAQTAWSYDEASFPLLTYPSVMSWTDPATTFRGNPTTVTTWLNFNGTTLSSFPIGTFLATHAQYDQCGSVRKQWDASDTTLTNPTLIDYSNTYHRAYPTTNTSSDPDGGGPLLPLTTATEFDFSTGFVTATIDANSQRTTYGYNDPLNRLKQLIHADTDPVARTQTTYTYDDVARTVTATSDLNAFNDNALKTVTFYDAIGRVQESRQYESVSWFIATQTQYDNMGRAFKTSNPYRQGEPIVWTIQAYDGLGRVTSVMTPDNAVLSTTYTTNSTTVTDPAGKSRRSVTDSLGRVVDVYEDPAGVNYQTTYLYDTLDNLVRVTQGTQQRFFMYDSLKRIIRVRNVEQATNGNLNLSDPITGNSAWCMGYKYDADGNKTQRVDPRGVETTYVYDALSRNTNVNYSDSTPDVLSAYDAALNGKGRINQVWQSGTNTSATYIDSYDALGRPQIQRQRFETSGVWSDSYQITRTYNRAGGVVTQTYPSLRTVNYTYDAAGRANTFTGTLGDSVLRNYATGIDYSVWGTIGREQYGAQTSLYRKSFYNIRGQLFDTRVSSVNDVWDWNRGRLIFYYSSNHVWGQSGTDNNGNVRFSETWIPPENAQLDQAQALIEHIYEYDSLNRISSAREQKLEMPAWVWQQQFQQSYTYDRYGNRTINSGQTWGTGINSKQFTVDTATNRLGVPGGQSGTMSYDFAGNLLTDTYTGSGTGARTYDAENKMTTAADITGQTSRYSYDAAGNRVRRQVGSSQEMWQIYGMDGELVAEYRAAVPPSGPEKEYGYRNGQLLVTATGRFNVALASNGAVATASSTATGSGFSTTGAINGNFRGPWGNSLEGWNDNTPNSVPDWIQVDFAGSKTIDEINVFSLHDNYLQENNPTLTQTFSLYGLLAFNVQYWNGSTWVTIPGGTVTGNNKVWRNFTFAAITTNKIRVFINQVPDAWSRVVEIQAFGTSTGGEKIQWLVPDHLGTPRMIVDNTGTLAGVRRHDYLPFGEELFAGIGGHTVALGYAGIDGVRQQFTSQERDVETGLDYFVARYFSSVQGRFASTDPLMASGHAAMPQSWNRYSYVMNNPLLLVDPSGEEPTDPTKLAEVQRRLREAQEGQTLTTTDTMAQSVDVYGIQVTDVGMFRGTFPLTGGDPANRGQQAVNPNGTSSVFPEGVNLSVGYVVTRNGVPLEGVQIQEEVTFQQTEVVKNPDGTFDTVSREGSFTGPVSEPTDANGRTRDEPLGTSSTTPLTSFSAQQTLFMQTGSGRRNLLANGMNADFKVNVTRTRARAAPVGTVSFTSRGFQVSMPLPRP